MSSLTIIAITISACLIAAWYYFFEVRRSGKKEEKLVKTGDLVLCRISDTTKIPMTWYMSQLPQSEIDNIQAACHTLGRQYDFSGVKRYWFIKYLEGEMIKYRPLLPDTRIKAHSTGLFNDIQQIFLKQIITWLSKDDAQPFLEKYKNVLLWAGIMALLAFMWANGGG